MKDRNLSILVTALNVVILFGLFTSGLAEDANQRIQDRVSPPSSTRKILSPSGREPVTKALPTTDQKFTTIFSKLATLEQIVASLQNQVTAQAQLITQLKQVISVNSSGTVTIQTPGTLKIAAGGNLNFSGSTVDVNTAITGIHGILKADTMMTTTVIAKSYTPGAGNIW
ncbi:MAG: hypothetical protein KC592_01710 [Nitrospira sp.]|nr:hypothetical protein [Nitrospira sp.]